MDKTYTFTRYLSAKKSVDDRALNRHVWETLVRAKPDSPLRVLEIGAGIGAMIERLLEWEFLDQAEYTALDSQAENIEYALERLPRWAENHDFQVERISDRGLTLKRGVQHVQVKFEHSDVFEYIDRTETQQSWDLLIAHAFLDLVDIPTSLPPLFELCRPGGLFYFSINYDGLTALEPPIEPELDERILRLYNLSMDERLINGAPSGDSQAGRQLFEQIKTAGGQILAAGPSDWVVFPGEDGYPQDEGYFLHFIIDTIRGALVGHPDLPPKDFLEWVEERHAQIERRQLVYIAHQLDFAGKVPPIWIETND